MTGERKLTVILVADVVGYSLMAGTDEDQILARLRRLRSDLIDPTVAVHHGRIVKRMGDGIIVEFRSVIEAARCAIEIQAEMEQRNFGVDENRRIDLRVGIHVGDVVEESDGDLMGDGVNIASRLEAICDVGGVCVSEDAYRHLRERIPDPFEDIGEQNLKNIVRPIRAFRLVRHSPIKRRGAEPNRLALPDKPSIAVLPFQNMSGEPEQDYFADGMVEDITTGLSRIKWLFVIARNSSFIYKGKVVDVRQVGHDLGVRYVLEGGVRKAGNLLRITAQLVEAETRTHLWADKFDGAIDHVFDLQDQITDRVVGIVEPSLQRSEVERSRRKRPENLEAYDLFLRAMPHLQARMPQGGLAAIPLLEKALDLEPDYSAAEAHLAWCHEWCFTRGGLDERHRKTALLHARSAIGSDIDDAAALAIAAWVIIVLSKEREAAVSAIDRALALNPSCATAHYFAALIHSFSGSDTAVVHAKHALRLSPFDPSAFEAHLAMGFVAVVKNQLDAAVEHFATGARINPRHSLFPFLHGIALALVGRRDEAEISIQRGLDLEPGFRIQVFNEFGMAPTLAQKLIAGARMVSLPE